MQIHSIHSSSFWHTRQTILYIVVNFLTQNGLVFYMFLSSASTQKWLRSPHTRIKIQFCIQNLSKESYNQWKLHAVASTHTHVCTAHSHVRARAHTTHTHTHTHTHINVFLLFYFFSVKRQQDFGMWRLVRREKVSRWVGWEPIQNWTFKNGKNC